MAKEKDNLALRLLEEGREPTAEEKKQLKKELKKLKFETGDVEKRDAEVQKNFGREYIRWLEELGIELPDS